MQRESSFGIYLRKHRYKRTAIISKNKLECFRPIHKACEHVEKKMLKAENSVRQTGKWRNTVLLNG